MAINPARSTPSSARTLSTVLAICMPTIASVVQAHAAQPPGDRRDHAIGLRIGEAARRAVGEAVAVGRVEQRNVVGPPLRRPPQQLVQRGASAHARCGRSAAWIVEDQAGTSLALVHRRLFADPRLLLHQFSLIDSFTGFSARATRFPADSRRARSPPVVRSWSNARSIAPARETAERRRSPRSTRGRARAPRRRSPPGFPP